MRWFLSVMGLGVCLSISALGFSPASTPKTTGTGTFLIPAEDGYGIAGCLDKAQECGRVVANAWCEAQGFQQAVSFGPPLESEENTDPAKNPSAANMEGISVTCGS